MLVIIGNILEGMLGEGVSVERLVGSSDLIYRLVERHTASVDYDDRLDSDLILLRYVTIVRGNKGVEVHSFSFPCHTVSFL